MIRTKRLLTPREVAEYYQVTPRTVIRWINEGKLEGVKVGRVWRIRPNNLRDVESDGVESE